MPAASERAVTGETSFDGTAGGIEESRQTEIEDLHAAVAREEDFSGLRSRCTMPRWCAAPSPRADLERHVECGVDRQRAGAESRAERLAIQIFGDAGTVRRRYSPTS